MADHPPDRSPTPLCKLSTVRRDERRLLRELQRPDHARQGVTGTYTVKPDCTGTETVYVGGSSFGHYDEFLSPDGNLVTLSATDDGAVLSGTMYRVPMQSKT